MTIKVNIKTDIFEADEWNHQIKKAGLSITETATTELKKYTPVDTGLLTSQWRIKSDKLGLQVSNNTPYANFIDKGTVNIRAFNMVEKATPKILNEYEKAIYNHIDKIN